MTLRYARRLRVPPIVAVVVACGAPAPATRPVQHASSPPRGDDADVVVPDTRVSTPVLERVVTTELGLEFARIRGIAVEWTPWPRGGVVIQGIRVGDGDLLQIVVRTEPDESMEGFRSDHADWRFSEAAPIEICGQRVRPVIATHAAQDIECVITTSGDNHPAWIPPQRAVAVQFVNRGMPVVASFRIQAKDPGAWSSLEAQFLGSFRCL